MQRKDQIDDCQTLIEYFSGMSTTAWINFVSPVTGEGEEDYLKDRSEFKKDPKAHSTTVTGEMSSSSITDPIYARSTLRSLSILPPSSQWDVPRVVQNLETRKAWLEEIAKIQNPLEPLDGAELQDGDAGKPKSEELQETEVS